MFARAFAIMIASTLFALAPASAHAASRDCSANAVVYCGATTISELTRKLQNGDGKQSGSKLRSEMQQVNATITAENLRNTVPGYVYKDGHVTANGKRVANNAYSYGRQNISGSTQQGSLYKRSTNTSFNSERLEARVYMKDGVFQWAVILSCGNPVVATPVKAPAKKVAKPQVPNIVNAITIVNVQAQQQQQQQQTQPTVTPAPAPVPQPAPAPAPAPVKTLPDTGAETAVVTLAAAALAVSSALLARSRQRLAYALRRKRT